MTHRILALLTLIFWYSSAWSLEHFNPTKGWKTLTSEHIVVTYEEPDQAMAQDIITKAEAFLPKLENFLSWSPQQRIEIVLSRQTDQANGYATPIPFSRSVLFDAQPSGVSELQDYSDWMELLIVHELTHIVHLDKARGWSLFPRQIFGRNLFTFSNLFQPNFFKEGLAVYVETSWAQRVGRGQSAFYDMMMREEVASGLLPLEKAQQRVRDWPLNKDYLYGVYFYQFLDEVYGVNNLQEYIHTYSGQLVPFIVDRPIRKHTDVDSMEQLWADFEQWLNARFAPQIEAIQLSKTTPAEKLSESGYFNSSPIVDSNGNVFFISFDRYSSPYIVQYQNNGELNPLTRTHGNSKLFHADSDALWYLQQTSCEHNTESFEIYRYDLKRDSSERITDCLHVVQASMNNGKIALVQNKRDGFDLSLLPFDNVESGNEAPGIESLSSFTKGENIGSLVWLSDSTIAFTHKQVNQPWSINQINIETGKLSKIYQDGASHAFEISRGPDNSLIVSSDEKHRIELWQLSLNSPKEQKLTPLTNSTGGASNGHYDPKTHSLIYRQYSHEGWDIVRAPFPSKPSTVVVPTTTLKKPGEGYEANYSVASPQASVTAETSDYNAFNTVYPRSWFFGYQSDNAQSTLFFTIDGRDTLNFHNWAMVAGRDFDNDLNLFSGSYTLYNHFTALYSRQYDYTLGSTSGIPAFIDKPRFIETEERIAGIAHTVLPGDFANTLLYAGFNFDESDSQDQSVQNNNFLKRSKTSGIGLVFDNREHGLYSINSQWGRTIQGVYEQDRVSFAATSFAKRDTDGDVWSIDWREYLTLYQAHTLTLHAMTGRADNGADPFDLTDSPGFSAFEQTLIHRREYPLRAYPDQTPELVGLEPRILSAQYDFPIVDVDQGLPGWPFGLYSIQGALFYESGKARSNSDNFNGYGAEIGIGLDVGFGLLPVQLRFGIAQPEQKTIAAPDKDPATYIALGIGI